MADDFQPPGGRRARTSQPVVTMQVVAPDGRPATPTHFRRHSSLLLVVVVALLVAGGMVAVRQQWDREQAARAAVTAEARRVDDESRNAPDVDRSLLLAVEANRLQDSTDTRAVLADLLSGHPALIRSVPTPQGVQALAVSADGATLLAGTGDGGTTSYRTDTLDRTDSSAVPGWTMEYRADGQQVLFAGRGHGGLGEAPDQLSAAVTDGGLSAMRWVKLTGLQGNWVYAKDAAYSTDGRSIAVYAESLDNFGNYVDSAVAVWDVAALNQPILNLPTVPSFAVALSPNGRRLYVATQGPAVTVIDVPTGAVVNSVALPAVTGLPGAVDAGSGTGWSAMSDDLVVSPDGTTLAVAEGNDIALFDTASLTEIRRLRGHNAALRALRFSPDGSVLASGSADHTAVLWDLASGGAIQTLSGHTDAVTAVAFSPDGGTLYTGSLDHHILVWDLTGRRQFLTLLVAPAPPTLHAGAAVPSPDGQAVGYPGSAGTVRVLDVASGELAAPQPDPGGGALAAWLPPTYHRWVSAAGRAVRIRDRDGVLDAERTVAAGAVTALAASSDGGFILVGDNSGGVGRFDVGTLAPVGSWVRLDHPVVAVAAAAADTAVVVLGDRTYAVVDLAKGDVVRRGSTVVTATSVAVSPDGRRVAIGGSHGEVGLLDMDSQQWISSPTAAGHEFVDGMSFSADGMILVTSTFDGDVRLWDAATGLPSGGAQTGPNHSPAVATLLPDGHAAVIATRDGGVYRLNTDDDAWIGFACAVAGRNLTNQEWLDAFGAQPYHATCPTR